METYKFVDGAPNAYRKELLDNEELSNVVREMILNDCVSATGYYSVEDATSMVLHLDEYLKHNVANLSSYEFGNQIFLVTNNKNGFCYDGNTPMTKLSVFNSLCGNNLFSLYTDGYPGEIHYKLKKPLSYKELAESNLGVVSLDITPYNIHHGCFSANKCYIKNGLYCRETCQILPNISDRQICARVYDLNAAINRNACNDRLETLIYPCPEKTQIVDLKNPWFIEDTDGIFTVIVFVKDDGGFVAYYKDETGAHSEDITGDTIYSAYYDFMVKKGFFDEYFIDKEYNWVGKFTN